MKYFPFTRLFHKRIAAPRPQLEGPREAPRDRIEDAAAKGEGSSLLVALRLPRASSIDLFATAGALEAWVRKRVQSTGQRIDLMTEHHAHDGAIALSIVVPADWVIDAGTSRAGLRWSVRGRGVGVKHGRDVLGSVFVTAVGAARILGDQDGIAVVPSEIEIALDDPRSIPRKQEIRVAVVREVGLFLKELFGASDLRVTTKTEGSVYRVRVVTTKHRTLTGLIEGLLALAAQKR